MQHLQTVPERHVCVVNSFVVLITYEIEFTILLLFVKHDFVLTKDTVPYRKEHTQLLLRTPQDNIICQAVLHRDSRLQSD